MDKTTKKRMINMAAFSMVALLAVGGTGVYAADKKEAEQAETVREDIGFTETEGVLFLPLTDVVESQGGSIGCDKDKNRITVTFGENTVDLYIGISRFEKNGAGSSRMEGAPYMDGDTVLCPVEVFTDGLDMEYELDEKQDSLRLYKKENADDAKWAGTGKKIIREYNQIQKNVVDGFNDMVEYFTGKYLDDGQE